MVSRRRVGRFAIAFALICPLAVGVASAKNPALVPGPALPNHRLTPGAHFAGRPSRKICKPGYSARRARAFPRARRTRLTLATTSSAWPTPTRSTTSSRSSSAAPNAITNLWPEDYDEPRVARATEDRLENQAGIELVCSGRLSARVGKPRRPRTGSRPTSATLARRARTARRAAPSGSARVALKATIRAAFYYPWFPQTWGSDRQNPFTNYVPTRGRYRTDLSTVRAQIADMQYGRISVGLASWFGQGSNTNSNWPVLFRAARGTGFRWAPYYEPEGTSDPTPRVIAANLHYLRRTYGGGSALAMLPGKRMLVFVYNADDLDTAHGCATVTRWKQAKTPTPAAVRRERSTSTSRCSPVTRPAPTTRASTAGTSTARPAPSRTSRTAPGDGSYAISPGFWKAGNAYGTAPFLARDRARWQSNIAAMNASGAKWQLITTYNEWGEGTAIESSSGCRITPPPGAYCDWSAGGTTSEPITDLHNAPPA